MIASEAIQLESGRRKGRKNDCARVFDVFPLFSPLYYYLRATLRFFLSFRGLVSILILIFLFFASIFVFSCFVSLFSMPATTRRKAHTSMHIRSQQRQDKTQDPRQNTMRTVITECTNASLYTIYLPTYLFFYLFSSHSFRFRREK